MCQKCSNPEPSIRVRYNGETVLVPRSKFEEWLRGACDDKTIEIGVADLTSLLPVATHLTYCLVCARYYPTTEWFLHQHGTANVPYTWTFKQDTGSGDTTAP